MKIALSLAQVNRLRRWCQSRLVRPSPSPYDLKGFLPATWLYSSYLPTRDKPPRGVGIDARLSTNLQDHSQFAVLIAFV
jgi:hypothetical protein